MRPEQLPRRPGSRAGWPVRLTVSPSTIFSQSPNSTAPTLSDSRFSARPVTSCGSSSISNDMQFSRPWMRAMPSRDREHGADLGQLGLAGVEALDAALEDGGDLVGLDLHGCQAPRGCAQAALRDLLAKLVEAVADGGVEDRVADAQDDAAEDVGVDVGGELDLAAGLLADRARRCARRSPRRASTALVISTGRSLFSSLPERVVARGGCGRSPACGASR